MSKIKTILVERNLALFLFYKRLREKFNSLVIRDERYIVNKYRINFDTTPNLENPYIYNEYISKILHTQPSNLVCKCADKYLVREYVREKIGSHLLNDIYGVYNKVKDLEKSWHKLPNQFVLKAAHGCGWNYICKNKGRVDFNYIKTVTNHWLKSNFYHAQRELVYKNIKPKIIAEKYLEDESGGLMDFKIHCFYGEPKFINVIKNRFSDMKLNTYDMNWNFIDVSFDSHYPNDKNWKPGKPSQLEEMVEYSRKLSEDFKYVRVDFYIVQGKVYFGELTFTPGNGAYTSFTKEDDIYFGSFFTPPLNTTINEP